MIDLLRHRRAPLALVLLGLLVFGATRLLHPVRGLGNPDIGGILYSADTINLGLLPYRDTIDVKQPGTFFLFAGIFRISRSILALQLAFAAWLLLGAPAIWRAARALYPDDERPLLVPSVATAVYLFSAGAFDLNYAAWMMVPYAWSFAWLCCGLRDGRVHQHLLAGAFAAIAYTFKAQAAPLAPLFVVLFVWARRRGWQGASLVAWPAWVAGAAIAMAPLVILYAARGALGALVHGLFPLEDASAYSNRPGALQDDLKVLWKVPRQQFRHFFLPLTLAIATIVGLFRARRSAEAQPLPSLAPALCFYVASLIGCGIGGRRFFTHYLAQCLPALALLAAHPAALAWLGAPRASLAKGWWLVASRLHGVIAAALLLLLVGRIPLRLNVIVDNRGSPAVERAGRYVREHSEPGDPLLVWGWGGWGAYFFAERRSPSKVFKVLGQATEYNDNTGFMRATSIAFKPGPYADMLLADVRARPPAFIVRASPFFPGTAGDPLDQWPEMLQIVAREYRVATRFDHLIVYERRRRPRRQAP